MGTDFEPVHVTGDVHVKSMPKTPRQPIKTQPRTYLMTPGDPNGPQMIRPETSKICHTVIAAQANPANAGSISNPVPAQPSVPATGVAQENVNAYPVQVVISANGATITNVSVNGVTVGNAAGTYVVPADGAISIAYSVATPTWVWSYAGANIITTLGYGWIGSEEADTSAGIQRGALLRTDLGGAIRLDGQSALWALADPASPNAFYLSVWLEMEAE